MRRLALLSLVALACGAETGTTTDATTTTPTTDAASTTEAASTGSTAPTTGATTDAGTTAAATTAASGSTSGSTSDATAATTAATTGGDAVIVVDGLSHPESILHDTAADIYLISNINGAPDAADDNGFIARVQPDGTIETLEWISGADMAVQLDAPKGMAIVGDTLYVADLTVVRKFDRTTGAVLGQIALPGAVFLNDLSADPKGRVHVSDNVANLVFRIAPDDTFTVEANQPELAGPNGLVADDFGVNIATYDAANLVHIDGVGPQPLVLATLPMGGLDGLAHLDDGDWLVTSWDASAIYRVSSDFKTVEVAIPDLSSPADIDIDRARKRVLVPLLLQDRAEFHPLP
jgi:hypothetical protein